MNFFKFCVFGLGISLASAGVQFPTGPVRSVQAEDFFRHPQNSKEYNEVWSYQLVTDDGAKVWATISYMFVPTQGTRVGTDLGIFNFKGQNYSVGRQFPSARFSEDKKANVINIKNEYLLEGLPGVGHRVYFTTEKNQGFFLDIRFTETILGKVPGDGIFHVNGHRFAYYLHIPWGRFEGRLGVGKDTISVRGYGFMEQFWQTTQATKVASRSIVLSSPNRNKILAGRILVGIAPTPNYFGYVLQGNGPDLQVLLPATIQSNGEDLTGRSGFPGPLQISWTNESIPPLIFDASKRQQRFSILSNFDGWLEKRAIRMMMGGELLFLRGRQPSNFGTLDFTLTGL